MILDIGEEGEEEFDWNLNANVESIAENNLGDDGEEALGEDVDGSEGLDSDGNRNHCGTCGIDEFKEELVSCDFCIHSFHPDYYEPKVTKKELDSGLLWFCKYCRGDNNISQEDIDHLTKGDNVLVLTHWDTNLAPNIKGTIVKRGKGGGFLRVPAPPLS